MQLKWSTIIFIIIILAFFNCNKEEPQLVEVPISELLAGPIDITLDPNGITPLAAKVSFQTNGITQVEWEVQGLYPVGAQTEVGMEVHEISVLGLYAGKDNPVIIKITHADRRFGIDTLLISTAPLPDYMPEIEIIIARKEEMEPGMNLSELNVAVQGVYRTRPLIFDHNGDIRWYILLDSTGGWTSPFERLQNGNFVFSRKRKVYEYNMIGDEINSWAISGHSQHHDLFEKPDGNFLIPTSKAMQPTSHDYIIELDRATGEIIREWDLRRVLDVDRYEMNWNNVDWLHVNSVWYDERDESLIISGRSQGVLKVSKDNNLHWILAPHKGWELAGQYGDGFDTKDFLLSAIDETGIPYAEEIQTGQHFIESFDWAWGQHGAMILPNGHLFVFDNGWNRRFSPSGQEGYIRGVEYEIDEENGTVKEVWQYGRERGQEIFSHNISDVDFLPKTGNRLICPGNIEQPELIGAKIIEVSYPNGQVIFEANIRFQNIDSNWIGWEESDIVYKSERLTLYP